MSLLFWLFDWCSADYSFQTVLIDLIVASKEINKKQQEGQHFYNPKSKTVNKLGYKYHSKLKLLLTLKNWKHIFTTVKNGEENYTLRFADWNLSESSGENTNT